MNGSGAKRGMRRSGAMPAAFFASASKPGVWVMAFAAAGQSAASRAHQGMRPKA